METILKIMFSSTYNFWGVFLVLATILGTIISLINRLFSYLTIRRWGYPPSHCDVTGELSEPLQD